MSRLQLKEHVKIATERALEIFRKDPDLSIDRAAKMLHAEKMTLDKDLVAAARRQVRYETERRRRDAEMEQNKRPLKVPLIAVANKHEADVIDAARSLPGWKGPRVVLGIPKPEDMVKFMPEPAPAKTPVPPEPHHPPPSSKQWGKLHAEALAKPGARKPLRNVEAMKIRRDWLNEFLDQNPGAHPLEIIGVMRTLFGIATTPEYVYETCRVARELHGLPPLPTVERGKAPTATKEPEPMPAPQPTVIPTPEPADDGTRVLMWRDPLKLNQPPSFEQTTKEKVGQRVFELMMSGVKQDTIRVFRPAAFKLSFSVEIG